MIHTRASMKNFYNIFFLLSSLYTFLLSLSSQKYLNFLRALFFFLTTRCSLYHRQLASDKFSANAPRFKIKTKSKERLNHSRSVMGRPVSGFLVIAEIPNRTLDARVREMVEQRLALESRATDDRRCNAWTTLASSVFCNSGKRRKWNYTFLLPWVWRRTVLTMQTSLLRHNRRHYIRHGNFHCFSGSGWDAGWEWVVDGSSEFSNSSVLLALTI